MFTHFKTLRTIIVLKRGALICLYTIGCAVYKLNFYHASPQFHITKMFPMYENIIVPKPIMLALSFFPFVKDRIHRHIKMSKNVIKYLNHILFFSNHSIQNSFCEFFHWRIVWCILDCRSDTCFKSIV